MLRKLVRGPEEPDFHGLRRQYLRIIVAIKGSLETELLFEDLVGRGTDAGKLKDLKAAQDLLKHP